VPYRCQNPHQLNLAEIEGTVIKELAPEQLRKTCDPSELSLVSPDQLSSAKSIVGQDRAVQALEFGLETRHKGFHIYVSGPPGTGKATALETYLTEEAQSRIPVPDYCYVNQFNNSDQPQYLRFSPSTGRVFQSEMRILLEQIQSRIPLAFESQHYLDQRERIAKNLVDQKRLIFSSLNEKTQSEGFSLQQTQVGTEVRLVIAPVINGETLTEEDFLQLPPEKRQSIMDMRAVLDKELRVSLKEGRHVELNATRLMSELDREVAGFVMDGLFEDMKERYHDEPKAVQYLESVRMDMLDSIGQFFSANKDAGSPDILRARDLVFRKYAVNLIVDNSAIPGVPVVIEQNPTYPNIFGRLEKEAMYGAVQTDFTLLKAGSLLRANGGYLVMNADDLVRSSVAYETLKRALRNKETTIEEMGEQLGVGTSTTLRPEPIPLDVKIVLVGSPNLYYLLHSTDEDFREVFKVKADFDTQMDRTSQGVRDYLAFISKLAKKEGLLPADTTAAALLIEEGSRLAENQDKLSTQFGDLADILREADYWAEVDESQVITDQHIRQAIQSKAYRAGLIEDRVREFMEQRTILVDTQGSVIGQVNALSVMSFGDYSFGRACRITTSVGLGQSGLLDIERESNLGGPIHTKGVLILAGYLSDTFAQDKPLNISARLVFEQSYEGVDGDSASSAELYTLLSALSGQPINQSLAVTGSINQRGDVQAIGGVNQKIEGFYDLCLTKGLTGHQGVVIPASNVQNLMLRSDIVDAVRARLFHVYAIDTVDQGIELLTGLPAGELQHDGSFPSGSINALVDQKLHQMTVIMNSFQSSAVSTPNDHSIDE
jgi:lon-related putative ATP-dependent protease